jgi:hypothetical protein
MGCKSFKPGAIHINYTTVSIENGKYCCLIISGLGKIVISGPREPISKASITAERREKPM